MYLPMMADCERALGRPERALALAKDPAVIDLDEAGQIEMKIVESGARRDLGDIGGSRSAPSKAASCAAGRGRLGAATALRVCRRAAGRRADPTRRVSGSSGRPASTPRATPTLRSGSPSSREAPSSTPSTETTKTTTVPDGSPAPAASSTGAEPVPACPQLWPQGSSWGGSGGDAWATQSRIQSSEEHSEEGPPCPVAPPPRPPRPMTRMKTLVLRRRRSTR